MIDEIVPSRLSIALGSVPWHQRDAEAFAIRILHRLAKAVIPQELASVSRMAWLRNHLAMSSKDDLGAWRIVLIALIRARSPVAGFPLEALQTLLGELPPSTPSSTCGKVAYE